MALFLYIRIAASAWKLQLKYTLFIEYVGGRCYDYSMESSELIRLHHYLNRYPLINLLVSSSVCLHPTISSDHVIQSNELPDKIYNDDDLRK